MAQLYLVAFKENNNGTEPEENYALRELLQQHCSYCIPAGKTTVWGPDTHEQRLAEICWLTQEIGYYSGDYKDLIDELRAKYTKIMGLEPPEWSKYFEDNKEERLARRRREEIWRREKGWLFQRLILVSDPVFSGSRRDLANANQGPIQKPATGEARW